MTDPAIIEAAARALRDKVGSATFAGRQSLLPLSLDDIAQAVLAAVTPLIRAAALEEAARVAENQPSAPLKIGAPQTWIKQQIAAAIRALKEQP